MRKEKRIVVRVTSDDMDKLNSLKAKKKASNEVFNVSELVRKQLRKEFKLQLYKKKQSILFQNEIDTIYEFKNPLNRQPEFFQMNSEQTIMIIASSDDGIYKDMNKQVEIDLDDRFNIGCIKEIIHDEEDHVFYILANKFDEKL